MKNIFKIGSFRKYFRKDNLHFTASLMLSLLGQITSGFSLIQVNDFNDPKTWVILLVCIICFIWFIGQIYYKYEYYHGLAMQLQKSDRPLFLICSYISKSRNKDKRTNDFKIKTMNIIYDIDVPSLFAGDKPHTDFTVTYECLAETSSPCTKIYHTILSTNNRNHITAEYRFDSEDWSNMQTDSYYASDKNLTLWYGVKSGNELKANMLFQYSLRFTYNNGYNCLAANRLLIDPKNYGKSVDKIHIVVRSKSDELKELIDVPQIISYFNGVNINDRSSFIKFEDETNSEYKSYFTLTVRPERDSIYVLELMPKFSKQNP